MAIAGSLLMCAGVLMIAFGFGMDASVSSGFDRVVNAHLLHIKAALIQVGGVGFLSGAVFLAADAIVQALAAAKAPPAPVAKLPQAAPPPSPPKQLSPTELNRDLREASDGHGYHYRGYRIATMSRDPANLRYRAIGQEYGTVEEAMAAVDKDLA